MKSLFRGVPNGAGLTRSEQTLKATAEIFDLLKNRLPDSGLHRDVPQIVTPNVVVNMPDIAARLAPELDQINRSHAAIERVMETLTGQGEASLRYQQALAEHSKIQSTLGLRAEGQREVIIDYTDQMLHFLKSLDRDTQRAVIQRIALIACAWQTNKSLNDVS